MKMALEFIKDAILDNLPWLFILLMVVFSFVLMLNYGG